MDCIRQLASINLAPQYPEQICSFLIKDKHLFVPTFHQEVSKYYGICQIYSKVTALGAIELSF